MLSAYDAADERQSLTARERELLASLARRPFTFSERRTLPNEYRALVRQGLAFWSHALVSATPAGLEVLERVG